VTRSLLVRWCCCVDDADHKILIPSVVTADAFRNRSYRACSVTLFRINPVSACRPVISPDYVFGGRSRTTQIIIILCARCFCVSTTRRRRRRPLKTTCFFYCSHAYHCNTLGVFKSIRLNDFRDVVHTQTCIIYVYRIAVRR